MPPFIERYMGIKKKMSYKFARNFNKFLIINSKVKVNEINNIIKKTKRKNQKTKKIYSLGIKKVSNNNKFKKYHSAYMLLHVDN
jgi:hypothetical protein